MRWTNASVTAFAQGGDPIEAMETKARIVALSAIDRGWSGPPFDPLRLADLLGIHVVPTAEVPEARTVPLRKGIALEFNPTRPRGRVRFSIAHEIAHTFFADCNERIRNRQSHVPRGVDDWQLELLCNIGASELVMPVGTILKEIDGPIGIAELLELRRKYDVSTEALLIRIAKLTRSPMAVFCASKIESGAKRGQYRVDYAIPSRSWSHVIPTGLVLPAGSVIRECAAVGFSAHGSERWISGGEKLVVECVGLPPYPGSVDPRVAGIVRATRTAAPESLELNYLFGDALSPRGAGPKLIVHIVNDRTPNWGGGGFAVAVRRKWPSVQTDFKDWAQDIHGKLQLGAIHVSRATLDTRVVSMIAQKGFGPSSTPRIRYSALEQCLGAVAHVALQDSATVHMPKIGSGNAGGSWAIIEELLIEHLAKKRIGVNVYSLPPRNNQPAEDGFLEEVAR